jgi:hypothetical protein
MSDILLHQKISEHRALCVSELSQETLADQAKFDWTGPISGLFLYVVDERPRVGGITVLASVACPDAAFHLFDLLASQMSGSSRRRVEHVSSRHI